MFCESGAANYPLWKQNRLARSSSHLAYTRGDQRQRKQPSIEPEFVKPKCQSCSAETSPHLTGGLQVAPFWLRKRIGVSCAVSATVSGWGTLCSSCCLCQCWTSRCSHVLWATDSSVKTVVRNTQTHDPECVAMMVFHNNSRAPQPEQ